MASARQQRRLGQSPAFRKAGDRDDNAPMEPRREPTAKTSEPLSGTLVEREPASTSSGHLPQDTIQFTSLPALQRHLAALPYDTDSITVGGVDKKRFDDVDAYFERRGYKRRLFFLEEHRLLIITIPNPPHEVLHGQLDHGISGAIRDMGLGTAWVSTGAGRYPDRPSTTSASQGEGDSGGQPLPEREGRAAWPTIVIEAGFTQSLDSLRTKMHFWFARSGHSVKIVLIAKAFPGDRAHKRIMLEQWQERDVTVACARPGATATRLSSSTATATILQPVCMQTINITWAVRLPYDEASRPQQRDPESFNVVRGPLRLEFSQLFLRQPNGANEHDLVLSENELQRFAAIFWLETF